MEKKINEISNEELCQELEKINRKDLSLQIDRNEYLILKDGYFEQEKDAKIIAINNKLIDSILDKYQQDKNTFVVEGLKRLTELYNESGTKRMKLRYQFLASELKYNS